MEKDYVEYICHWGHILKVYVGDKFESFPYCPCGEMIKATRTRTIVDVATWKRVVGSKGTGTIKQ